jgi:hypothetical protein
LENLQTDDPVAYQNYIQKIQTALQDVPTARTLQEILGQSRISQDDLDYIVDNLTRNQEKALADINEQLGIQTETPVGKLGSPPPTSLPSFIADTPIGTLGLYRKGGDVFIEDADGNFRPTIPAQPKANPPVPDELTTLLLQQPPQSAFREEMFVKAGKFAGTISLAKLRKYIVDTFERNPALRATQLKRVQGSPRGATSATTSPTGSAFPSSSTATAGTKGKGISLSFGSTLPIATNSITPSLVKTAKMIRGKNDIGSSTAVPQPLRGVGIKTKKIGTGIKMNDEPVYKEFGKYCIHIPQLLNKDVLNVKYKSLGGIPDFKPIAITENYKDFILDLLNTNQLNKSLYKQLPLEEKKHFEKVSTGAGIFKQLGLSRVSADDDKKEMERFELVRGEIEAGNDTPKLLKEMKHFIIKFLNDGKITKQTAFNLLLELSV